MDNIIDLKNTEEERKWAEYKEKLIRQLEESPAPEMAFYFSFNFRKGWGRQATLTQSNKDLAWFINYLQGKFFRETFLDDKNSDSKL